MTPHLRQVSADSNGNKSGIAISWAGVKGILAILTFLFGVSWSVFTVLRSMDQKLIALQMEKTTQLIERIDAENAREHKALMTTQREIKDNIGDIRAIMAAQRAIKEDIEDIKDAVR